MKGDATVHTTNQKYRDGYDRIDWKPMPSPLTVPTTKLERFEEIRFAVEPKPKPKLPPKLSPDTEIRECGCVVMKGWRCQYHGDP